MIKLETFTFNAFQENTYLIWDETLECVIVDAGCYTNEEKNKLSSFIENNSLKPVKLVNTHCHVDHVLGNAYCAKKYGLKLEANILDKYNLDGATDYGKMFGFVVEKSPDIAVDLLNIKELKFGNSILEILQIPGHCRGHIGLLARKENFVITGDVLFLGSIGRTDLPGGDYDVLMKSIKEQLFVLPDNAVAYPGHGEETTIGFEKENNPFIN
jgi:glyoxylase-like metal-dependent hydrolase (beta-lactamase superfamily II)